MSMVPFSLCFYSAAVTKHISIDPELTFRFRFEYLWQDNENFKRPTKMPAPEYIEHLMAWVQSNIDNEQMFPSRIGLFPPSPFMFFPLALPPGCSRPLLP